MARRTIGRKGSAKQVDTYLRGGGSRKGVHRDAGFSESDYTRAVQLYGAGSGSIPSYGEAYKRWGDLGRHQAGIALKEHMMSAPPPMPEIVLNLPEAPPLPPPPPPPATRTSFDVVQEQEAEGAKRRRGGLRSTVLSKFKGSGVAIPQLSKTRTVLG